VAASQPSERKKSRNNKWLRNGNNNAPPPNKGQQWRRFEERLKTIATGGGATLGQVGALLLGPSGAFLAPLFRRSRVSFAN